MIKEERRRGLLKGARLPSAYQEVEWVSSGDQRGPSINTGVQLGPTNKVVIDFKYNNLTNEQALFGLWATTSSEPWFGVCLYNSKWYYGTNTYYEYSVSWYGGIPDTERHLLSVDATTGEFKQDGNLLRVTAASQGEANKDCFLFSRNLNNRSATQSMITCYSFKVYSLDTEILYLIPCYRKSDNEIGMYDIVNDVFYTNQGTGTFTKGPDVTGRGI